MKENLGPSHADHGKWNQPAGWLDVGEDPVAAVTREVKEETGYEFTPMYILGLYSLVKPNKPRPQITSHPLKVVFRGTISGTPAEISGDVSETRWFSPEEIYAMDKNTLRDIDIKTEVRDYLAGRRYPLELITHTVQGK